MNECTVAFFEDVDVQLTWSLLYKNSFPPLLHFHLFLFGDITYQASIVGSTILPWRRSIPIWMVNAKLDNWRMFLQHFIFLHCYFLRITLLFCCHMQHIKHLLLGQQFSLGRVASQSRGRAGRRWKDGQRWTGWLEDNFATFYIFTLLFSTNYHYFIVIFHHIQHIKHLLSGQQFSLGRVPSQSGGRAERRWKGG